MHLAADQDRPVTVDRLQPLFNPAAHCIFVQLVDLSPNNVFHRIAAVDFGQPRVGVAVPHFSDADARP